MLEKAKEYEPNQPVHPIHLAAVANCPDCVGLLLGHDQKLRQLRCLRLYPKTPSSATPKDDALDISKDETFVAMCEVSEVAAVNAVVETAELNWDWRLIDGVTLLAYERTGWLNFGGALHLAACYGLPTNFSFRRVR